MKTLGHSAYVKAWLVYILSTVIMGGIIGMIMGVFLGMVLTAAGVSASQIKIVTTIVGLAFGIPFSYFMFWACVKAFVITKLQDKNSQAT